jgi:hypothetical protein
MVILPTSRPYESVTLVTQAVSKKDNLVGIPSMQSIGFTEFDLAAAQRLFNSED